MPEDERAGVVARLHEELLDELGQAPVDRGRLLARDRDEQVDVERAPDDGRGAGQRPRVGGQSRRTGEHGVRQGVRHVRPGADELLHVQGDPVAAGVQRVEHVVRRGGVPVMAVTMASVSDRSSRRSRSSSARRCVSIRDRHRRVGALGYSSSVRNVPMTSIGKPGEPAGHALERVQRDLVGPVQVLQREEHGRRAVAERSQGTGEVCDEGPSSAVPVRPSSHRLPPPAGTARPADGSPRPTSSPRSRSRPATTSTSRGNAAARTTCQPVVARGGAHVVEQAGLADARLTGQEEELAGTGSHLGPPPGRDRDQVVATEHDGRDAHPAATGGHGSESRRRRRGRDREFDRCGRVVVGGEP